MVPGEQYDGSTGDRVPGHRRHAHLRTLTHDVRVLAAPGHRHDEILTPAALDFIGRLAAAFGERRQALLKERRRQVLRLASGSPLDFPMVTSAVRADPTWRVAPPAPGLTDRRVEITGPPDRRMAVNALSSGAKVWMADFEDATAPLWENIVGGSSPCSTRSSAVSTSPRRRERSTGSKPPAGWPPPSYGRVAGTSTRSICSTTALFFTPDAYTRHLVRRTEVCEADAIAARAARGGRDSGSRWRRPAG